MPYKLKVRNNNTGERDFPENLLGCFREGITPVFKNKVPVVRMYPMWFREIYNKEYEVKIKNNNGI